MFMLNIINGGKSSSASIWGQLRQETIQDNLVVLGVEGANSNIDFDQIQVVIEGHINEQISLIDVDFDPETSIATITLRPTMAKFSTIGGWLDGLRDDDIFIRVVGLDPDKIVRIPVTKMETS